jgi:electron transfer flavoprotein alpha/beta subunit
MADHGARAAQAAQQAIGQDLVVFGNQNAHGDVS